MGYQTPCVKCRKTGVVRIEHVFNGDSSSTLYYCERCEHEWTTIDAFTDILTPPCIYCADGDTADVTPSKHKKAERLYLCGRCQRRFIVRFTPESVTPTHRRA